MNHLEKKECCEKCSNIGRIDNKDWGCDNSDCSCHTPTPYSVLREKVKNLMFNLDTSEREGILAEKELLTFIDEYRENLARSVESQIPKVPEGGRSYEAALIATVRQDDASIIRRT